MVEPLKSPPSTPLSCPSSAASLSQGPPTPSIHPVSPSFAINLPSPALSVCFPLIQDGFDALSPSLGLKLSVDTGPSRGADPCQVRVAVRKGSCKLCWEEGSSLSLTEKWKGAGLSLTSCKGLNEDLELENKNRERLKGSVAAVFS